ncbi:MAG TPA: MFS transporter [Candidatus Lokiarchaeia archaeon]|nr:MFS transporter [Candidatus Lokiarchaeia archaeon]
MSDYKWNLLLITTVGTFMGSLDGSIVNIAIPTISMDLKAPFELIQWVTIVYLLVMAISLVALGRLGDIHGRKNFFLLGLAIFTTSSFLCAMAITPIMLVSFRAIQGFGSSLIASSTPAMVTETFPPQERGKAMGINVASIYLGLTIGPVLGGILTQFSTWRSIFTINLPIGAVVFIAGLIKLKPSTNAGKKQAFDIPGMVMFALFLAPLLLALTLGNLIGWGNISILIYVIIAAAGLAGFLAVESKVTAPMINLDLFRHNRMFAAGNVTALLNYIAINGVLFLLSIYLQSFRHFLVMIAGMLMLPAPLTQSLISLRSGRLSDKIGSRALCAAGMGIIGLGIFMTIVVINFLSPVFLLASLLIMGAGTGLFSSPNQSAIMGSVEKRDLGIAAGVLSTMRTTGQSISVALLSAIVGMFIAPAILNNAIAVGGPINVTPEIIANFQFGMSIAYLVSICLCMLGVFTALMRGAHHQPLEIHEAPADIPPDA